MEYRVEGVHIVGTLRANRGAEREHMFKPKASMGKADYEELTAKPLFPERVKVRVTGDEAQVRPSTPAPSPTMPPSPAWLGLHIPHCCPTPLQVQTVSIFDKKDFQMIDTVHNGVDEETKQRLFFDRYHPRPRPRPHPRPHPRPQPRPGPLSLRPLRRRARL